MACPTGLDEACGGKRLHLTQTFNQPEGAALAQDMTENFLICTWSAPTAPPSCKFVVEGTPVDVRGAGGFYGVED
jgi:hypothetical protein